MATQTKKSLIQPAFTRASTLQNAYSHTNTAQTFGVRNPALGAAAVPQSILPSQVSSSPQQLTRSTISSSQQHALHMPYNLAANAGAYVQPYQMSYSNQQTDAAAAPQNNLFTARSQIAEFQSGNRQQQSYQTPLSAANIYPQPFYNPWVGKRDHIPRAPGKGKRAHIARRTGKHIEHFPAKRHIN